MLRQTIRECPYVWLAFREASEPDPTERMIWSDQAVPGWERAEIMISLRGRHGRLFHRWRIVAAFVHGELTSGNPGDLD
jgi:hypothetical protein